MAKVYVLQSIRDGRYYVGSTIHMSSRWRHHKGGFTPSTKRFGPCKIVLIQEYPSLDEARYVERRLKDMKRKDYIDYFLR